MAFSNNIPRSRLESIVAFHAVVFIGGGSEKSNVPKRSEWFGAPRPVPSEQGCSVGLCTNLAEV